MDNPYEKPQSEIQNRDPFAANPYQAPQAALIDEAPYDEDGRQILEEPRKRPASAGMDWVKHAWELFKGAPMTWILMFVIFFCIMIFASILTLIPLLGLLIQIGISLMAGVMMAGFVKAAQEQDEGSGAEIGHLFAGFQDRLGQLALLGLLYFGASIVVMIPGIIIIFLAGGLPLMMGMEAGGDPSDLAAGMSMLGFLLGFLVMMALFIPVIMAYWFAPALVLLDDYDAIDAMKLSFKACWRNMIPFLIYGLVAMGLLFLGILPFGLGLLIVWPILVIVYYTSYKDILVQDGGELEAY